MAKLLNTRHGKAIITDPEGHRRVVVKGAEDFEATGDFLTRALATPGVVKADSPEGKEHTKAGGIFEVREARKSKPGPDVFPAVPMPSDEKPKPKAKSKPRRKAAPRKKAK